MSRVRITALFAAAIASMGTAAAHLTTRDAYQLGGAVKGGQAYRGEAGMAHGTKVRGNRAVRRVAAKARNVKRHRAHCKGGAR